MPIVMSTARAGITFIRYAREKFERSKQKIGGMKIQKGSNEEKQKHLYGGDNSYMSSH